MKVGEILEHLPRVEREIQLILCRSGSCPEESPVTPSRLSLCVAV